jgi:hypothetical protein
MSKKCPKALPYMLQTDSYPNKEFASWLRNTFGPFLAKRLPTVLYSGFKHGFIPSFIQKHKKTHPYFVKIDLQKFYPSVSHHQLVVESQMAYKNLLGLTYVLKKFKQKFLPAIGAFFNSLPLQAQGTH